MKQQTVTSQQTVMEQRLTPLQVQYVRMLEMSAPEVEDAVHRTIDENHALEIADDRSDVPDEKFAETSDEMQNKDYLSDDDRPDNSIAREERPDPNRMDAFTYSEATRQHTTTLIESLTEQMRQVTNDPLKLKIADNVIGNLDRNGRLERTASAIASDMVINEGIDVTTEQVKEVIATIRTLDPAGICSYDLRDCLLLQAERMDQKSPYLDIAIEILRHYYDLFAKLHLKQLRSAMHISEEELNGAITLIKHLNPKPGAQFAGSDSDDLGHGVTPDFAVEHDDEGHLTLTLLSHIPSLVISESYSPEVIAKLQPKDSAYIKQKRDEAANFIKAIEMRRDTMFNVMRAVLNLQSKYFETGDEADIRPMLLRDVAEKTGYDVSTVSRATSNKYVQTGSGTVPLKIFFNERVATSRSETSESKDDTSGAEDVSTRKILSLIRSMIDNENKQKPLSDETLRTMLNDKGYDIARRTVTKYRERLRLPVARLRKKS